MFSPCVSFIKLKALFRKVFHDDGSSNADPKEISNMICFFKAT